MAVIAMHRSEAQGVQPISRQAGQIRKPLIRGRCGHKSRLCSAMALQGCIDLGTHFKTCGTNTRTEPRHDVLGGRRSFTTQCLHGVFDDAMRQAAPTGVDGGHTLLLGAALRPLVEHRQQDRQTIRHPDHTGQSRLGGECRIGFDAMQIGLTSFCQDLRMDAMNLTHPNWINAQTSRPALSVHRHVIGAIPHMITEVQLVKGWLTDTTKTSADTRADAR